VNNESVTDDSPVDAATIVKMITTSAAAVGEDAPTDIQWIITTRAEVAKLLDFGIPADQGDQTQVLVAARGEFKDSLARVPPGADAPSGTVLGLVIDPKTWQVMDYGLGTDMPDLRSARTTIFRP
jgi:hypothetical protein